MPYYVYILYSKDLDQYYISHTSDLVDRIFRHKNSGSKSTKKASDWSFRHKECYEAKSEAYIIEMEIKN